MAEDSYFLCLRSTSYLHPKAFILGRQDNLILMGHYRAVTTILPQEFGHDLLPSAFKDVLQLGGFIPFRQGTVYSLTPRGEYRNGPDGTHVHFVLISSLGLKPTGSYSFHSHSRLSPLVYIELVPFDKIRDFIIASFADMFPFHALCACKGVQSD